MMGGLLSAILLWLFGLLVFYLVIVTAVKDGINKSMVGQYLEKNDKINQQKRKSWLDHDLDHD
jgi:ABC-type lipoprotein release transport system permease subunit